MEYFGIDIGDGESAVAFARELNGSPDMLQISGHQSVLSAYSVDRDGRMRLGTAAVQNILGNDTLYARFKSRFLVDPQARRQLETFAGLLRDGIRGLGRLQVSEQAQVFIGCPSGWTEEARAEYQALMARAGFPNVTLVSESRAALIQAAESGDLRLSADQMGKPVLIVDAGSSTIDFTYITDMCIRDSGVVSFGGGLIDELLLDLNVRRMPERAQVEALFEQYPRYHTFFELEARRVKESYFIAEAAREPLLYPVESSFKVHADPPIIATISCCMEDMEQLLTQPIERLEGRSFKKMVHRALLEQREGMGALPEVVLMTGGASRMPFMGDMVREIFPDAQVVMGVAPEFSIARGLYYALSMERRRMLFEAEVEALIQSDVVESIVMDNLSGLFERLAPVLVDAIVDELVPVSFKRWQEGTVKTLDDMYAELSDRCSAMMRDDYMKERLEPIIAEWLQGLRPLLEQHTTPICYRHGIPLSALQLPDYILVKTGVPFGQEKMVNFDALKIMIDVVVLAVAGTIAGGAETALIATGPIGWIIGAVVGLVVAVVGTHYAEKAVRSANLPQLVRKLFSLDGLMTKMNRKRGEMTQALGEDLAKMLALKTDEIVGMCDTIAKAIETDLHQKMTSVVFVLIDGLSEMPG